MKRFLSLLLSLLTACNSSSELSFNPLFADKPIVELTAEKVSIEELLEPGFVVKTDDYLVFFGESGKNRDLFYVYTIDDLKFAYSFGSTGRAANEFLLTSPVYQLTGNNFLVLDCIGRKLFKYKLDRGEETLLEIIKMDLPMGQPIQEMTMINENICLFSLTEESGSYLYSYDLVANKVVDKITMNSSHIGGSHGNVVYIAHEYIDEISMVVLDDNYAFKSKSVTDFEDRIMYNGYMRHDGEYVAVTRVGRESIKMSPLNPLRDFRFNIEIYDKELNPIAVLKPDQNILRFEIDIDRGYIYSWDVLNGFEHIHRYNIDELKTQ